MHPLEIKVDKQKSELFIEWDDLHKSIYPFGLLRNACPCASCRGGHEKMSAEPDPDVFERKYQEGSASKIESVDLVGNYALNITWADGHHYGIYNWAYLRLLCDCTECKNR